MAIASAPRSRASPRTWARRHSPGATCAKPNRSSTGTANSMAILTEQSLQRIERETKKYPPEQRQSAVMSALAIAQDQEGWLSNEVMEEVARVLRMPPVWVYEVA